MNQEKIGKLIKEIRTNNNLSQKEFANIYGVTYQAVSKWENGKNMPDIEILKKICSDYDISLEEMLNGKNEPFKLNKLFLIIPIIVTLILLAIIIFARKGDSFEFRTLESLTNDFTLTGSIAYNSDKTSIFISDVKANFKDEKQYQEIKSALYEIENETQRKIGSYEQKYTTLNEFLSKMFFHVDDDKSICKEYEDENLLIEITATDKNNVSTKFSIPLKTSTNCKENKDSTKS